MAQRIERSRDELQLAEHPVGALRGEAAEDPADDQHQHQRQKQPDGGRDDDRSTGLEHAAPHNRAQACLGGASAQQPADQRMAGRRGDAQRPGDEVPGDRAHQSAEDHLRVDDRRVDNALAHRFGDVQAKEEEGDEVEEGGPGDGILRLQYAGRHDGRDRVRRVVQAIEKIKGQRDADQRDQQREEMGSMGRVRDQAWSMTRPLISFATSSNLSVTFSRWL